MPVLPAPPLPRERPPRESASGRITIGLVNNMPDSALRTTERQFCDLLSAAGQGLAVSLRFFSFPDLPREQAGRIYITQHHEDIGALWDSEIDGLIVTGTEPRAARLPEEPYWPTLTRLIDWAEDHTTSTVWSCLAAHAAVLHRDGICRHMLPQKLSGVFDCATVTDHTIIAATPSCWQIPHSRCNDVPEEALVSRGYRVLSRSPEAGADLFVKQGKSLFLFFQGHPEYDPGALFREYRRDVGRFLNGERETYPGMPCGYFDKSTAAAMAAFRERALQHRHPELLSSFPACDAEQHVAHTWRGPAVRLYANWLFYLASRNCQTIATTASQPQRARVAI
jgi:homoserine O-succinyltransferase/O-acetyltransferase